MTLISELQHYLRKCRSTS